MAIERVNTPNPESFTIPRATAYIDRVGVRELQSLRTLRNILYRDPVIKRRFEDAGGFENILIGDAESQESMEAVERWGTLQNATVLDRIANGDVNNVPALETMFELEKDNRDTIKGIAQHLEDCCEEIKQLLKDLRRHLNKRLDSLHGFIHNEVNKVVNLISNTKKEIYNFYQKEKASIITELLKAKEDVLKDIRSIVKEELQPLKDDLTRLDAKLDRRCDILNKEINDAHNTISEVHANAVELLGLATTRCGTR